MVTRLGIDVGGSGIKAAPVDAATGELMTERIRVLTPRPATPAAIAGVVAVVARHFDWTGAIGVAIPAVVRRGVVRTNTNIHKTWRGVDALALFGGATGSEVTVLNDADAAGIAEVEHGVAKGRRGTVVVVTLGTGIGTAVLSDGVLVPNTELGHLRVGGKVAERRAADSVRERDELSWERWARRLTEYFKVLEALLWPDLIIVGGGVSRKHEQFLPLVRTRAELLPARFLNSAGLIGAAIAAAREHGQAEGLDASTATRAAT